MAQREIDDVDPEPVLIGDGELDRPDDRARQPRALRVEHLQADDARSRRDALIGAARQRAVARHQPGDVRAVPVLIGRDGRAGDEIEEPESGKVGARLQTRINHRDANTPTAQAAAGVGARGVARHDRVGGHSSYRIVRVEHREVFRMDRGGQRVDGGVFAMNDVAVMPQTLAERRAGARPGADDDAHRTSDALTQRDIELRPLRARLTAGCSQPARSDQGAE